MSKDKLPRVGKLSPRVFDEIIFAKTGARSEGLLVPPMFSAGEGKIPKLFYESEGWGKEPLFVLLGRDAVAVAREATEIARAYAKSRP